MFHDVFEVKPKLIRIVLGWASLKEVQYTRVTCTWACYYHMKSLSRIGPSI
jgi:hypothetical protein